MGRIKKRVPPQSTTARKMPLRTADGEKGAYSSIASTIVRQLALGGIALVWLIKVGKPEAGGIRWHSDLMLPMALFALALLLDLLQYVWGTIAWNWIFSRAEAEGKGLDDLISPPEWVNKVTYRVFFMGKVATVIVAYGFLLCYMFNALKG